MTPLAKDKFTLILDSTQIQSFSECPELWNLAYRQHLVHAYEGEKEAMNAGTYGHAMLDVYYKGRAAGRSLDDSLDLANEYNIDAQTCQCGHRIEDHCLILKQDKTIREAEDLTCDKNGCACEIFQPVPFALSQDLRYLVRARFRDHIFKYRNNDIQPFSPESVEVGFSEPIYEDADNLFVLEGRLDVLGAMQGVNLVMDHKFQMRRRDLYKKSIQFRNYNLVSGYQTLLINYVRLTKKIDESTFVREAVSFLPGETRWWRGQLIKYFWAIKQELILHSPFASITPTEPLRQEWGACAGKFGYPCSYTELCEHTDPQLVQIIKDTRYKKREPWSPWS